MRLFPSLVSPRRRREVRPADVAQGQPDPTSGAAFDEQWYLTTYRDVREAVAAGAFGSGYMHFMQCGRHEGRRGAPRSPDAPIDDLKSEHAGAAYLAPRDLCATPTRLRRVMVLGGCLAQVLTSIRDETMDHEPEFFLVSEHTVMPDAPPHPPADYDFFIVQMPLRSIMFDTRLWRLAYDDLDGHRVAFDEACAAVDRYVETALTWTAIFGIPAFVGNFMLPQADLTGRLLPRYDLRNAIHFVEELNRHLERSVSRTPRAYILDLDRLSASFGRRHVQDDAVLWAAHNSLMPIDPVEDERIEAMPSLFEHYDITWYPTYVSAVWAEAVAMHRSLRQVDAVKLVVVDLDDTLWTGVSGDAAEVGPGMIEGWPLGFVEALVYLRKRGVLLAILSKNDEARIRAIWPRIFRSSLVLEDFAVVMIDWRPKPENMADVLRAVHLLPESTVFVDDNPVERAAMRAAYPGMRVLGRYPFYLRRTLLWSSETQVETISPESAARTRTVRAQVERDASRTALGREAFLATLDLKVACTALAPDAPRFGRALELLNKTNQFNTTGRRWTREEIRRAVDGGARVFVFEAEDKFTAYGLIGVCIVEGATLAQLVMSCRVNGLDVELAALSDIVGAVLRERGAPVTARLVPTPSNLPCRDLWARCGFERVGDDWVRGDGRPPEWPAYIARAAFRTT